MGLTMGLPLCPSCLWRPQVGVFLGSFSFCSLVLAEAAQLSQPLPPQCVHCEQSPAPASWAVWWWEPQEHHL